MIDLDNPIISAVRSTAEYDLALTSPVSAIFLLSSDVMTLQSLVNKKGDKKIFVHIDMSEGVGKDKKGIEFLKSIGVDGIISTKNAMIAMAKEKGLMTVQRFFIIDSKSVETTLEIIKNTKPDFAELMPGVIPKAIKAVAEVTTTPIITGGLIQTKADVVNALSAGAYAVSTASRELWEME